MSIHVKFEESNAFVKNIVEIDFLGEDMKKISLKDWPIQKDKSEDDEHGEVQEVKVEPTQLLLKNWRFASNHPKDLIIRVVSKG